MESDAPAPSLISGFPDAALVFSNLSRPLGQSSPSIILVGSRGSLNTSLMSSAALRWRMNVSRCFLYSGLSC